MQSFPEFFHAMNEHMFMLSFGDNSYKLFPPNQEDWFYTLTKQCEECWVVHGENQYETIDLIGSRCNESWVIKNA